MKSIDINQYFDIIIESLFILELIKVFVNFFIIYSVFRSEDKFIIYNCQRLGINEEAFRDSAAKLKSKTSEQVIFHLNIQLLQKISF